MGKMLESNSKINTIHQSRGGGSRGRVPTRDGGVPSRDGGVRGGDLSTRVDPEQSCLWCVKKGHSIFDCPSPPTPALKKVSITDDSQICPVPLRCLLPDFVSVAQALRRQTSYNKHHKSSLLDVMELESGFRHCSGNTPAIQLSRLLQLETHYTYEEYYEYDLPEITVFLSFSSCDLASIVSFVQYTLSAPDTSESPWRFLRLGCLFFLAPSPAVPEPPAAERRFCLLSFFLLFHLPGFLSSASLLSWRATEVCLTSGYLHTLSDSNLMVPMHDTISIHWADTVLTATHSRIP
jgi:hypothetical protein